MADVARVYLVGKLRQTPKPIPVGAEPVCRMEVEVAGSTHVVVARGGVAKQCAVLSENDQVRIAGTLVIEQRDKQTPSWALVHVAADNIIKVDDA